MVQGRDKHVQERGKSLSSFQEKCYYQIHPKIREVKFKCVHMHANTHIYTYTYLQILKYFQDLCSESIFFHKLFNTEEYFSEYGSFHTLWNSFTYFCLCILLVCFLNIQASRYITRKQFRESQHTG